LGGLSSDCGGTQAIGIGKTGNEDERKTDDMKSYLKKILVYTWEWLYLKGAFPSLQNKAVIFMMHRMSAPGVIEKGHSAEFLDQALTHLRKKGYNLVSLDEIVRNINSGEKPLKKAVAFTLDDGYIEQAEVAAPVFIKHQCPATIFLITDFVDKGNPPWDCFLKFVLYNTEEDKITVEINGEKVTYDIADPVRKYKSMATLRGACKKLPIAELEKVMKALSGYLSTVPTVFLKGCAKPLNWDMARKLEKQGVSFGPHAVNHYILSQCTDDQACGEIEQSWNMLREKLDQPCPIFAYPTGRNEDFTYRDVDYIKSTCLAGAVTAEPGYVSFDDATEADKYLIKRMSFPSNVEDLVQYCSGFESVSSFIRNIRLKVRHTVKRKLLFNIIVLIKYRLRFYERYKNIDWTNVSRLVFVCKGNICRSPYAEIKAKQLGVKAVSMGLYTKEGSPANSDALRRALYRGVNLEGHKAKLYDSVKINDNDLVICMEPWHVKLFKEVDGSSCQVILLGLMKKNPSIIIDDPYGKPDIFFDGCFQAIDNALTEIIKSRKLTKR